MSTDAKGTKILARTFFNQLRASGYNARQIIGVATELIDLVTADLKGAANGAAPEAPETTPTPSAVHARPRPPVA